jgi:hypothetical protein
VTSQNFLKFGQRGKVGLDGGGRRGVVTVEQPTENP